MKFIFKLSIIVILFYSFTSAQEDRWGAALFGGLAIPSESFNDVYDKGFTFSGGVFHDFNFATRFSIILGYAKWEINNTKLNNIYSTAGNTGTIQATGPVTAIPLLLHVRWYAVRDLFTYYGLIEAGFYFTKTKFSGTITVADSTIASFSGSESSTNPGLTLGIGFSYEVADIFEFDLTGRYHIVSITNNYNFNQVNYANTISSDQYWSVTAGINIILVE